MTNNWLSKLNKEQKTLFIRLSRFHDQLEFQMNMIETYFRGGLDPIEYMELIDKKDEVARTNPALYEDYTREWARSAGGPITLLSLGTIQPNPPLIKSKNPNDARERVMEMLKKYPELAKRIMGDDT